MGYRELIESLKSEAEKTIEKIWKEKKEEGGAIKKVFDEEMKRFRDEYISSKKIEILKKTESIIFIAKRKSHEIKLNAEEEFEKRLYSIAKEMLPLLRDERYHDVFGKLASEISDNKWKKIIVNPDDISLAEIHFKNAEIIPDGKISGGFVAISEDGKITIDNTFEKRLERAWQSIIPETIKEIYSYVFKEYSRERIS